jgi:PAS domain S-box-containing protein
MRLPKQGKIFWKIAIFLNGNGMDCQRVTLLLIANDPSDAAVLKAALSAVTCEDTWELTWAGTLLDGLRLLEGQKAEISAVLLDLRLPEGGRAAFAALSAQTQAPLILYSLQDDEELAEQLIQAGAQDFLVKGQVRGDTLRRSVRYAIERQRTAHALDERNKEIQLIYEAGQALSHTLELDRLYETFMQILLQVMECEHLFISSYDPATQLIRCVFAMSGQNIFDVSQIPVIPLEDEGKGVQSRVIRSGKALLCADWVAMTRQNKAKYYIQEDGTVITESELPEDAEVTRSGIIVPLIFQGQVTGAIQILNTRLNAYSENDLRIAEALAAQIAVAANNAILYQQARFEINERKQAAVLQEAVYRIAEATHTTESLQELYPQIQRQVASVMYAEDFCIVLYDEDAGMFQFAYYVDKQDTPPTDAQPLSNNLTSWVLRNGKSLLYESDKVEQMPPIVQSGPPCRIYLGVPLVVRGKTIGMMAVQHYTDPGAFSERERRMLEYVSAQVAAAIDRKMASEALQKSQASLEALNLELERRVEERTADMRRSAATYRALFENSNDGIFLMSPEGKELQANPQAIRMLGYTIEEYESLLARRESNWMTPVEQQSDANARLEALLRGEPTSLYERTFITKDGRKVEVEINLSTVRDASGKVILVQSVVRDISERKKAEAALRESRDKLSAANAALENASRLKDEFLASMSHELRTPMTGILGLSEALHMQIYGELNEKQLKALGNIESSGRHLLELINDILDLSKIEAGKLEMQIASCSAMEVCQASLQLVKGMAHQKGQNLRFDMHPASILVRADARRLKQMLVNLLSNAVKFTPAGGQLGLEVSASEEENSVSFCVWDKGIGIQPEQMGKLFKPFVQLDSSLARQYSGTGLGLSLVQRMAELHGGSIKLESVPGEGSRFTILLPWSADQQQSEPALFSGSPASLKNVLVIEDNILDAENIVRYLAEIGIITVIQPTLAGALEKAVTLRPSAILLDLYMPDGYGLEFLAQLKADERTRHIPVIISSVEERSGEALSLGALGYLVKPFTRQDLRSELAKAASSRRTTEAAMPAGENTPAALVLIADDNEMILETISDFLNSTGYNAIATRSGFELLERASELHPDIIIVDIQMPGLDGIETIRRLRAHRDPAIAATPVIAVTALAMNGDSEKCLQAGADEYMSKPVVLTHLAQRISQLLEERK